MSGRMGKDEGRLPTETLLDQTETGDEPCQPFL